MAEKKIKAVLVKPGEGARAVELDDTLEGIRALLGCGMIDIRTGLVLDAGGKEASLDAICDDEGLLKPNPVPSIRAAGQTVVCGNAIICRHNQAGETESLTGAEVRAVMARMRTEVTLVRRNGHITTSRASWLELDRRSL